jgi:hypothetical protein
MGKKVTAVIALAAFSFFSASCSFQRVQINSDKIRTYGHGEKNIVGVRTRSEVLDFQNKRPARIVGSAVVGQARRTVSIDPAEIVESRRTGKTATVLMTDGQTYNVLDASRDGDLLLCQVLAPASIPLADIDCIWVKRVDGGKTALNVLAWTVVLPLMVILMAITGSEDDDETVFDVIGDLVSSAPAAGPRPKPSVAVLFPDPSLPRMADRREFFATEWAPLASPPDQEGAYRLGYSTGVEGAASLDMAELIVVDHAPGVLIAPDATGMLHSFAAPVPPSKAVDQSGADVAPLLAAKDAKFWESPGTKAGLKDRTRDELIVEFAKPEGARRAHLVVNATNSIWGAELARRSGGAEGRPVYGEQEFTTLKVQVETEGGWQARQLIHGGGPLSPEDVICPLDLTGVEGPTLRLRLAPPAGYWVFDRLAADYTEDAPLEALRVGAAEARDPKGADVLSALAEEDGLAVVLENGRQAVSLTFAPPLLAEGKDRSAFLRTVTSYAVPSGVKPSKKP